MSTPAVALLAAGPAGGAPAPPAAAAAPSGAWLAQWRARNPVWRGVHFWLDNDPAAKQLARTLPDLARAGVNVVVVEVNYSFEFRQHPELRNDTFIRRSTARELAAAAHRAGVRLIPEFNCLGHQSYGRRASPLLRHYPQYEQPAAAAATGRGLYCREWRPNAPGLNPLVFSLLDELADGFSADAFHVGMDEVYLLRTNASSHGQDPGPARQYAAQVCALHDHLVRQRHLEMLMWADRLIGPKLQGYSQYDQPGNDLSGAIQLIPHDIIQCDWHYAWQRSYPSVPYLIQHGYRVWPSGFEPVAAARAFSDYARGLRSDRVIGYLATTWNEIPIAVASQWPPIRDILPAWEAGSQHQGSPPVPSEPRIGGG